MDCRHLARGWRAAYILDGRLDAQLVLLALADGTPAGWRAVFLEDVPASGFLRARPGQVFTLLLVLFPQLGFAASASSDAPSLPVLEAPRRAAEASSSTGFGASAHNDQDGDVSTSLAGSHTQASGTARRPAHLLLFSPEYQTEEVSIRVRFPMSLDDVVTRVTAVREAASARRFPHLIPLSSQPPLGFMCLLATPAWAFAGVPILVACYVPPMRYFAASVPAVLTVEALARLARVPAWAPVRVLVSATPWAIVAGERFQVSAGELVAVYLENWQWTPPIALRDMIASGLGWHETPVLPGPGYESDWLLTDQGGQSFMRQPGCTAPLRVAISELWRIDEDRLTFLPSTSMIQDHACGGFPSNRVFLALRDLVGDGVPFVLDLRPLLLDINWELAPGGRVDVASVCTRLAACCPPSHFVRLVGGHAPPGMANHARIVFPGQVLWAEFWQRRGGFLPGQ